MKVVEKEYAVRIDLPKFKAGDTVTVHYKIVEGNKERIQQYRGVVIQRSGGAGLTATFTVRKMSGNIGVERIFPVHLLSLTRLKSTSTVKYAGRVSSTSGILQARKHVSGKRYTKISQKYMKEPLQSGFFCYRFCESHIDGFNTWSFIR